METKMITLTRENLEKEHLCCAIADKKHQTGVNDKRRWQTGYPKGISSANSTCKARYSSNMHLWKKPGFL